MSNWGHIHTQSRYWLAGLLEGEGSFTYSYSTGRYSTMRVSLGSRDEDVIERVHQLLGGCRYTQTMLERPFYSWAIYGQDAFDLMSNIYPMMCKRRQSQIADSIYRWRLTPPLNKRKVMCNNGHLYGEDNVIISKGRRRCRICTQATWRKADKKRREENLEDK